MESRGCCSRSASNIGGDAHITTSFGEVEAKDVTGEIVAKNEHGAITISSAQQDAQAETSFGPIDGSGVPGKLHARNRHGAIQLTLRSESLARVDAKTSFSPLEVRVAAPITPRIEARTEFDEVTSDYPVLQIQYGVDNFEHLDASVPRITLRNEHGAIRVVNDFNDSGR